MRWLISLFAFVAVSAQPPTPAIESITSAADYSGAATSGIARGSLFSVFGKNLSPAGARVRIWISEGEPVEASATYLSPSQINAVIPLSSPEGEFMLSVEGDGVASARVPVRIVASRFAAFTKGSRGFGPAAVQQYDSSGAVSLNGFLNPARPGQLATLWGTGLGTEVAVLRIAGLRARVFFSGAATQHPGVDQINFEVPYGVPEGCYVPVTVGSAPGALVTIAISASGGVCPSEFELDRSALERLEAGGAVTAGVLSVASSSSPAIQQSAEAWVGDYDQAWLATLASYAPRDSKCRSRGYTYDRTTGPPGPPPRPPDPGIYGAVREGAASVEILGAPGCRWPMQRESDGILRSGPAPCPASFYTFAAAAENASFPIVGSLPEPWPAAAVRMIRIDRENARVEWTAAAGVQPQLVELDASSSFTLSGNIFNGQTTVRESSCAGPPNGPAFPLPSDFDFVMGLPQNRRVNLRLRSVLDQIRPTRGPVDFFLIRSRNEAAAAAAP